MTLADTFESEQLVRRISFEEIHPTLSRELALGPYFDHVLVEWASGEWSSDVPALPGESNVTPTLELSGALAGRAQYQWFASAGLADLLETLDHVSSLIEAELRR